MTGTWAGVQARDGKYATFACGSSSNAVRAAADNDQDKDQVKAITLLLAAYLKGADSPGHFLRSTVTFEGLARIRDADLLLGSHSAGFSNPDSLLLIHIRGGYMEDVQDLGAYLSHGAEGGSVLLR